MHVQTLTIFFNTLSTVTEVRKKKKIAKQPTALSHLSTYYLLSKLLCNRSIAQQLEASLKSNFQLKWTKKEEETNIKKSENKCTHHQAETSWKTFCLLADFDVKDKGKMYSQPEVAFETLPEKFTF